MKYLEEALRCIITPKGASLSPFNPVRMESGEKKKNICEDTDRNNIFHLLKRIKTELKSLENEKLAWCSGSLVVFKWLRDAYTLI